MIRANIMKASRVVILAPNLEEVKFQNFTSSGNDNSLSASNNGESSEDSEILSNRKLTKDEEDLLDARTIFKYKQIL